VSARSDAWYAVPENRERRIKNMCAYMAAMVQLANRYPAEQAPVYRQARADGRSFAVSKQLAYAAVRDQHKAEFRQVLAGLREA
jgi:hypothetical protein